MKDAMNSCSASYQERKNKPQKSPQLIFFLMRHSFWALNWKTNSIKK